jgi:hypothetical protein
MPYAKQTWVNAGASGGLGAETEVNAERLSYMEDGIEAAMATAEAGGGGGVPSEDTLVWATYSGGTANRKVAGSQYKVFWLCTTAAIPPVVTTGTAGRYAGDIVSIAQ